MRIFVSVAVVVAVMMVGYGLLASGDSGSDTESPDNAASEAAGIADDTSLMSILSLDDDEPESESDAEGPSARGLDDERCFPGDATGETELANRLIIVDPGHGGEDLGTVNNEFGVNESDLVLSISELLRDRLIANGADVCMTRISDTYITLRERAEFANEHEGDVFVSMHLNSLPDPSQNYTMTMWGNEAKDRFLAETLVPVLAEEMATPRQLNGDPNPMDPEVYRTESLDSAMLKNSQMPAVLVEASFLSNTWEAKAFIDGIENGTHWRERQVASAVHTGLEAFFESFE
jgi:N-acetylmuramoyl-L-alanine amidase